MGVQRIGHNNRSLSTPDIALIRQDLCHAHIAPVQPNVIYCYTPLHEDIERENILSVRMIQWGDSCAMLTAAAPLSKETLL